MDPLSAILSIGSTAIQRIWPDPVKQAEEQRKLAELAQTGDLAILNSHVQLMLAQINVNAKEAESKSMFVAGWRPAVGWVCVSVLGYNYIGVSLLNYVSLFFEFPTPPTPLNMSELWPLLFGMLGIGGMRSFDKKNGVQTDSLNKGGQNAR
tara:strand:- start:12467 stop:12919 length:453 start_codon:yes stop_codon:yes gene_type:complete